MRRFTWLHAFFLACFLHGNEAAKHTCAARFVLMGCEACLQAVSQLSRLRLPLSKSG